MNSIPVLNSVSRSLAGDPGRAMSHSEPRPAAPRSSPERYNFDFTPNTDARDTTLTGFGCAQPGIPLSPLHDV